ncbi:MAG: Glu/Leu/Phe/Val dehydrogenase [Woeseiaceae bacterium]|nr:Glu/Leu/Phe/Val dehydrogenase [Woeseiaceae bacterium]
MSVFDHPEFDHHEAVHFFEDADSGLSCIIALHSTALGPAAGGCRHWQYANSTEALTDVLRLSRGMTYKNAVAGLPFGGGKAVILAKENAPKSRQLMHAFGRAVHSLEGRYITAEDVGIDVVDMQAVREITPHVTGVSKQSRIVGGDPSPWTARGVFNGIVASAEHSFGSGVLKGLRVAVQGVGHVGYQVCKLLHEAGAELIVADVNRETLRRVIEEFGATQVGIESILSADCDILSPCALGNVINQQSIAKIRAKVVAGAANNQLGRDEDGALLREAGILFAPDYVVNAGGIIAVAHEHLGDGTEKEVCDEIDQISARLARIYSQSDETGLSTNTVADRLAESIVRNATKPDSRLIA